MATNTTNYSFTKDSEDDFYNVATVNTNLDKIDAAIKNLENVTDTVLLAANWTGTVAPYEQIITIDEITDVDRPEIGQGVPAVITAEAYKILNKQYSWINRAVSGEGIITFYCYSKKPTIDLPITVRGV